MSDIITLNFKNAPPASGEKLISDHFPPGTYPCTIIGAKKAVAKSGNDMIVVNVRIAGDNHASGKQLVERYALPTGPTDQQFGLSRFHQLIIALGSKEKKGEAKIDLSQLAGRACLVEVDDEELQATKDREATVISRALAFRPATKAAAAAPVVEEAEEEVVETIEPEEPELTVPAEEEEPVTAEDDIFGDL